MFNYEEAFSRNIGWVTEAEQQKLRNTRVAIGGLGGVGGDHAVVLSRLGIGNFNISDLDDYDVANFNRQSGANMSTLGRPKAAVMEETIRGINPEADINNFDHGITDDNLEQFLDGVDIYIDSLDIFALEMRRKVFRRCYEKGIPTITAAPLGMGTAFLVFMPGKMSFDEYFAIEDPAPNATEEEKEQLFADNIIRFIVGVAPACIQRHYLAERTSVNFFKKKVPSTCMGISLAAGVLCTNALKIILNRGEVIYAPRGMHFDAYLNKTKKTWRPFGNKNPLQRYMFKVFKGIIDNSK
ncbi:ThiF family adenylyltransferase [Thalassotalea piscium]|uniref:Molybdopterin/thiamine biosynthesis adenylyltransferase n=1 Tax=Thalassotalea piscium TaxID=1230533 RepID=A0A7X0NJ52_9GAMM|nr:ThiF family adenylyltransferase [Thalassotalea piscium]MBB6544399.1 molybdopterin/thiamine biosynthesis adenylyltransferase [Thalassotalea piscium]